MRQSAASLAYYYPTSVLLVAKEDPEVVQV